jgi:hypothetical protein
MYAFDLIELDGDDLRREPLAAPGLRLNEHIEADGPTVFAHACKMGRPLAGLAHHGAQAISSTAMWRRQLFGRCRMCVLQMQPPR